MAMTTENHEMLELLQRKLSEQDYQLSDKQLN